MPCTLQHIQDELLVIRCQDGESDALEELIVRWRLRLHAHAWSLTRDAATRTQIAWSVGFLFSNMAVAMPRRPN